jgi:DNA ligase-1
MILSKSGMETFAKSLSPVSLMRLVEIKDPDELLTKYDKDNIIVEKKYDGHKMQIIKTNKEVHIYSRRGKEKTDNFPELVKALNFLPANTFVEGELVYWENNKQYVDKVTSLAGGSVENTIKRAKELPGTLKLHFYDVLWAKGKNVSDKPFLERRKILELIIKENEYIKLTKQYPFSKWQDVINSAIKEGGEGIVLKLKDKSYKYKKLGEAEPKPIGIMYKYKGSGGKIDNDDFVVYDYNLGPKGKLRALFGQYYENKLYGISEISNFSKKMEEEIKDRLKDGEFVIQIKFQERIPGGLRHQRYDKMRDDKKPKDATMNEFHVKYLDKFKIIKSSFYLSIRSIEG